MLSASRRLSLCAHKQPLAGCHYGVCGSTVVDAPWVFSTSSGLVPTDVAPIVTYFLVDSDFSRS